MSLRAPVYSLRSRFAAAPRVRLFDVVCAVALSTIVSAGCESNSSSSSGSAGSKAAAKAEASAASAADARCQQLLSSGLDMMRPESLGITAQEQQAVDSLNNWAGDCGKSTAANDPAPKNGSADAFADLYDLTDIEHVRNCWLAKQLGAGALKSQSADLDRIVGLFDISVRTVALVNSSDPLMPQTPYDTMVIGRGTAEDRAWLFGELLRQAGFDSVIVRPKASSPPTAGSTASGAIGSGASGAAPRWLVGVLLDKQVYLFDPTLGWPIPSPDDKGTSATVQKPATLAQVVADDKLLRKLDISPEKKYPLRASDLKSVQIEIITESRYSEPRIKRIESFLAGNRSTTVYAPLADAGGKPGLRSRIESAGGGTWKKEDVGVWEYPDKQTSAVHHLEGDTKTLHEGYWLPFEGPVELEFDMKTMHWKVSTGTTFKDLKGGKAGRKEGGAFPGQGDSADRVEVRHDARKQIKSRIAQLQGDYATAIRKYLNVQLDELPPALPLPEDIQEQARNHLPADKRPKGDGPLAMETPKREFFMNFRAAEDAKFWMAVCQMQQHDFDLAEETFSSYLRRYGQGAGTWVVHAAYLRSLCLAESKKFALALVAIAQLAQALQENDYRRPSFELLSERWRAARDASKPPVTGSETPPKEQSAPATVKAEPASAKPAASDKTPEKTPPAVASPQKTPPAAPAASDAKSSAKPKSP
jgi:hypothetical protein